MKIITAYKLVFFLLLVYCSPAIGQPVRLRLQEEAGVARQQEIVTSGLPFPLGKLTNAAAIWLENSQGQFCPSQVMTTATWPDGSVKWILLDFPCDLAAGAKHIFTLRTDPPGSISQAASKLHFEDKSEALWIRTGPLKVSVPKTQGALLGEAWLDRDGDGAFSDAEKVLADGLQQVWQFNYQSNWFEGQVKSPTEVKLEEAGPFRVVVKTCGWVDDPAGNHQVQYLARLHFYTGKPFIKVFFTFTQLSETAKVLGLRECALRMQPPLAGPRQFILGGQPGTMAGNLNPGQSVVLSQLHGGNYTLVSSSGDKTNGLQANGWLDSADAQSGLFVGLRHFWPQYPKSLKLTDQEIRLGLYPVEAAEPFDLDQGLAKTHELLLWFHPGPWSPREGQQVMAAFEQPLFAQAPPAWYCASKAFGDLAPFDFDLFPDYETLTEISGDQYIQKMATGFRNWGDFYYGGEFKGKNAYMNLEYDLHHNFYCQFARTGLTKYLSAAAIMGQHQADIDTNHKTHWQWKHSPRHVEIQAEFGHTFTRGLLETWYLTGNRRCLEAAVELGDFFIEEIQKPRSLGNERQIGWSLISLLPVYEATWDPRYFRAAQSTVDRLLRGLDARGKFDIRWDNRIAFFNGIAATGFIYYYRATGDERVAEAALRVIGRTKGMYPEYAGRTLEALAWAYQRTADPDYLDLLKLTYETTMARALNWNGLELGAPTIFTVHALPFLRQSGLVIPPERPIHLSPGQMASDNGLYAHHLPANQAEVYLQVKAPGPLDIILVRKGAWKAPGEARLYDGTGKLQQGLQFDQETKVWQRRSITLSPVKNEVLRLVLSSPPVPNDRGGSYITWDVITSQPTPAVFNLAGFKGLEFVTPCLYACPRGDQQKIELELMGEGEGFKKARLYDPQGNLAGALEAFIDLGDQGRYAYKLSVGTPPSAATGLWKISLQDVTVTKISGLRTYFATSKAAFFSPDTTE